MIDSFMKIFGYRRVNPDPVELGNVNPEHSSGVHADTTIMIDDWVHRYGPWHEEVACKCGKRWGHSRMEVGGVCPDCGYKERWITRVIRVEWEESPSRIAAFLASHRPNFHFYHETEWDAFVKRNIKIVYWEPERCEIKDKE